MRCENSVYFHHGHIIMLIMEALPIGGCVPEM